MEDLSVSFINIMGPGPLPVKINIVISRLVQIEGL